MWCDQRVNRRHPTAIVQMAFRIAICGEIDAQATEEIRQRVGPEVIIATPAASLRRAAFLAELGWERLARGDTDIPGALSPIYLQNPQINA